MLENESRRATRHLEYVIEAGRMSTGVRDRRALRGSESFTDVQHIHNIGSGNSNEMLWKRTDDGKIVQHSIGLVNKTGLHIWRIQEDVLCVVILPHFQTLYEVAACCACCQGRNVI